MTGTENKGAVVLQGAYYALPESDVVDEPRLAYYMSQLPLKDGQRLVEYQLLTPVSETSRLNVSAVLHCCNELWARVVHVDMIVDFKTGRLSEHSMRQVSTLPWDVISLVNSLSRRPPIQYHPGLLQPIPLEYPLDPEEQGLHSLLPLDQVGSSSR